MSDEPGGPHVQLLLYRFGPGAEFEGRLVGALQRLESGGALRILDLLFVRADPESGELEAVGLRGDGAGGVVAPLLGFRLDEAERRRATERTLAGGGDVAATARDLGATLAPGEALAAVLVDHAWSRALADAVARTGGTPLASEAVDAAALTDVAPAMIAAATAAAGG